MKQKKIAVIEDMSGFGRCSLTVAMPIISAMKVQCCPVPTSIFSNHTAYPQYFFDDYTDKMQNYIDYWKKLNLGFDGIYSGFLGSEKQIEIVEKFIKDFKNAQTIVIVDPAMADNGKLYSIYTMELCKKMKTLVSYADIITPNITEACFLTETTYKECGWKNTELKKLAKKLRLIGAKTIVISGVNQGQYILNYIYTENGEEIFVKTKRISELRHGTGDVFASIIAANAVKNIEIQKSVKQAAIFVKECIKKSGEMKIPFNDGVCFEEKLQLLMKK